MNGVKTPVKTRSVSSLFKQWVVHVRGSLRLVSFRGGRTR